MKPDGLVELFVWGMAVLQNQSEAGPKKEWSCDPTDQTVQNIKNWK